MIIYIILCKYYVIMYNLVHNLHDKIHSFCTFLLIFGLFRLGCFVVTHPDAHTQIPAQMNNR
jgi:flagellar biosynthesis component FlhA